MTEIVLVRQDTKPITEAEREVCRRVLFGIIDGLSPEHRSSWRRIWNWLLNKAVPGEMLAIFTHRERLGWFHRKHMALEQKVFQSQERVTNFKQFRNWLKIGAGHVDWMAGPKGGVIPVPKSTSYAELEQDDMERVHADMVEFLRTPHAIKYLWPHLPEHQRELAIEAVLIPFEEQHA